MKESKNLMNKIKKSWVNILLIGFLLLMVFSPGAKSWLLGQLVSTGLFTAKIEAKNSINKPPENLSFSFTDSNGDMLTDKDVKGKIVFINFWASWCPPCRAEMPSLNKLYNQLKADDQFVFLFINEEEDKAKAMQYLQEHQFNIPVYNNASSLPPQIFSGTLPTTVIIDKKGKLVYSHEGMADYNSAEFIRQLNALK